MKIKKSIILLLVICMLPASLKCQPTPSSQNNGSWFDVAFKAVTAVFIIGYASEKIYNWYAKPVKITKVPKKVVDKTADNDFCLRAAWLTDHYGKKCLPAMNVLESNLIKQQKEINRLRANFVGFKKSMKSGYVQKRFGLVKRSVGDSAAAPAAGASPVSRRPSLPNVPSFDLDALVAAGNKEMGELDNLPD